VTLPQGAGKLGLRGEFQQLGRSVGGGAERGTGRGSSCDVMVVPPGRCDGVGTLELPNRCFEAIRDHEAEQMKMRPGGRGLLE
jgi:hypothetical protein